MPAPHDITLQLAATMALLLTALAGASAQERRWLTGSELDRALKASVTITWQQIPLREGLQRLSAKTGVAIFLDRRLDPGQPIDLQQTNKPLGAALQELAQAQQAALTRVGSVLYWGPRDKETQLVQTASRRRQEIGKLVASLRPRLTAIRSWNWEELAQPRQLVEQLAQEAGFKVGNIETIPHDLWPAVSLPPLSWSDRMTLVLTGFGLTFDVDSAKTTLNLKPM